jgi:hypothetical protein
LALAGTTKEVSCSASSIARNVYVDTSVSTQLVLRGILSKT